VYSLDDSWPEGQLLFGGWLERQWIEKDLTLVTVPEADHIVQQDAADFVTKNIARWLDR
jgi:hypothetical protein